MSDHSKRRQPRRPGSASPRRKQPQFVPADSATPPRIGKAGIAACVAVGVVAVALVSLVWIVTDRAVQDHRAAFRAGIQQTLLGEASILADTYTHEIQLVDQSLKVLQSAWQAHSEGFDLKQWQQDMPALTAVARDLFIADDKQIIQQDILPQAVGQGVGAAYAVGMGGSLEHLDSSGNSDRAALVTSGAAGPGFDARQFLSYIIRPLDHPKGWIIGASYKSAELPRLFADAGLGENATAFLVDTKRGLVLAVMGNAARRPVTNIVASQFFQVIARSASGTWEGETPVDGVRRFLGFHAIPDRDMVLVVGMRTDGALALAHGSISTSYALAGVATVLVAVASLLVLWELYNLRTHRRRLRILARNRTELERLRADEATNVARAQASTARLCGVLDHTIDGFAIFDPAVRLALWNHAFQRGIGVALHQGIPLDTVIRGQAAAGLFGSAGDPEQEIARRVALLRSGATPGVSQPGPDGETLELRGSPDANGELILVLGGFARWQAAPVAVPADQPHAAEPMAAAGTPLEW